MTLVVGIDASRNRSGGAKAHLIGVLSSVDPAALGIGKVHVWSFRSLLDAIPDRPWLVKHNPPNLERPLLRQLFWQAFCLGKEVKAARCDILYTTDASTLCHFSPMVVFSQDMLSYEPGIMRHFGWGYARLRLIAILFLQNAAFRGAAGVVFLTRYSADVIQRSCGRLSSVACIPHGVDDCFRAVRKARPWPTSEDSRSIHCVYVSNAEMYKHQWVVVEAISLLRNRGFNISLTLVGGGSGPAQKRLERSIQRFDSAGAFVKQLEFVPHKDLPAILSAADVFIFASSCESMPVTLVEAMAAGLPIACSDRGPMPEVLGDAGVLFDPENATSIADAVQRLLLSPTLREELAAKAKVVSDQYTWERCAEATMTYIAETFQKGEMR